MDNLKPCLADRRNLPRALGVRVQAQTESARAAVSAIRVWGATQRMARVMAFVDRDLYDPELSPQKIANALHVSQRSLYNLFSESGLTVPGYTRD